MIEVTKHVSTSQPVGAVASSLKRLTKWWQAAAQAERFALVKASIEGYTEAPPLKTLQLAIYLAEVEAGEVDQG